MLRFRKALIKEPQLKLLRNQINRSMSASGGGGGGVVMSFGDATNSALGLPASTLGIGTHAYEPIPVPGLPSDITSVSTGHYHSFAISSQGHLWAWGRNFEAQLGRDLFAPRETWNEPKRVEGLDRVPVVAASGSGVVSASIGDDGSLWVWGMSKRGQLGLGRGVTESVLPSQVEALKGEKIAKVSFGWGHALAHTEDGKLFGWGYSADGRLGSLGRASEVSLLEANHNQLAGSTQEDVERMVSDGMEKEKDMPCVWEPRLIEEVSHDKVVDIACGFDHSLVLCSDGVLLSSGSNIYGQLGRANRDFGLHPVDTTLHPLSIAAGIGHSLAICRASPSDAQGNALSTHVLSWGWNQTSQLGRSGPEEIPLEIEALAGENVVLVSGGRVHSLALSSAKEVWVWGCGRNGRLGLGSSCDEPEPVLLDTLEGGEVLQAVSGFDHNLVLITR